MAGPGSGPGRFPAGTPGNRIDFSHIICHLIWSIAAFRRQVPFRAIIPYFTPSNISRDIFSRSGYPGGCTGNNMNHSMTRLFILAAISLTMASTPPAAADPKTEIAHSLLVFAAASTTNAINEVCGLYAAQGNGDVTPSFAASSTLANQIRRGAPADVYLSANTAWMDFLEQQGLTVKGSRFDLMGNRIVLIAPSDSHLASIDVTAPEALVAALGPHGRLALGDPDHVPAGIYGRKALEASGAWAQIKHRLAPMKDVRAALVLVEREETPLGLVYATDAAVSRRVRVVGTFPSGSHPPVVYPVAAIAGGDESRALIFLDFLKSPPARAIFEKYGFDGF